MPGCILLLFVHAGIIELGETKNRPLKVCLLFVNCDPASIVIFSDLSSHIRSRKWIKNEISLCCSKLN